MKQLRKPGSRPGAYGRALAAASALTIMLIAIPTHGQSDLLDGLKNNAKKAVNGTIGQAVAERSEYSAEKTGNSAAKILLAQGGTNEPRSSDYQASNWKNTQTYSDDAASQMNFEEAPPGSPSVLDIPLKGIRLGMPLRIAHNILTEQGFEYLTNKNEYRKEVRNVNGDIRAYSQEELRTLSRSGQGKGELLERYLIKLHYTDVSAAMQAELDPQRQAMIAQAEEIRATEQAESAALGDRSRSARGPRQSREGMRGGMRDSRPAKSLQAASYLNGLPVSLLTYIEYRQLYYGDQRFDYEAAKQQARKVFGPPNYNNRQAAYRRGAASKTSPEHQLVYADVLLVPAAKREALVQQANPEVHYAMKQGMSHPCSGIQRRCVNGAPVAKAFPGNLEKQLELARLQLAPYMIVTHDTSKGMKITQEWQYLTSGDTVREHFAKERAEEAQPVATPSF